LRSSLSSRFPPYFQFEQKSTIGTHVYGQTGTSAFREVPTFVEYLTYDKSNSQLYIGFNSANTTISPIIDNKTYQSIVRYDGSQFQNVADVDVLDVGMIAPLNNSNILVSPYTTGSNVTATLLQPARTSATNQSYIYNCGVVHTDTSLTVAAPINFYNGATGSSYTLYNKGDTVNLKWSSATNSWWA
jgi:hypothetical protein